MVATPGRDRPDPFKMHRMMNQYAERHRKMVKTAGKINHVAASDEFQSKMERLGNQMGKLGEGLTAAERMKKQMQSFERNELQQLKAVVEAMNTTDLSDHLDPLYDNQLDAVSAVFEAIDTDGPIDAATLRSNPGISKAITPPSPDISAGTIQPAPEQIDASDLSTEEMVQELLDRGDLTYCKECETLYVRGNVQFVQNSEDSSSEYDVVCENCYGSDVGFQ